MAHGTSRPVNPDTTQPVDFSTRQRHLDLPPREEPPLQLNGDEGKPGWAQGLAFGGWVVGLGVTILGSIVLTVLLEVINPRRDLQWFDQAQLILVMLVVGIAVAVALHLIGISRAEAGHRQHVALITNKRALRHQEALDRWIASRPLIRLAQSSNPLPALRNLMKDRSGSLVLGVEPDTQELATVGRESSLLALAPPRSGKTTGMAAPMLFAHYGPAVVTSTKNDLMELTCQVRASRGDVWIFDPAGDWEDKAPPEARTAYWTPLWSSCTWKSAVTTAKALIKATPVGQETRAAHWATTAKMALGPCLLAAALHKDLTMADVLEWVSTRDFSVAGSVLFHVANDLDHPRRTDAMLANQSLRSMLITQGDQKDGILGTLTTVLESYNTVHAYDNQARQNFDPAVFVRSTDTVYIASTSATQEELGPVIVAFIDAIQQAAYDFNAVSPFSKSDRPSLLMCLDEVANVAPMRELPRYLSEAGGQGVQMVAFLQSMRQAYKVWPEAAPGFLDYFTTVAAFGGLSDKDGLESLSVLTGDYDRQYFSNSQSHSTQQGISNSRSTQWLNPPSSTTGSSMGTSETSSESVSFHKERRLTPGDIASLPPKHALVVSKHEQTLRGKNFSILEMVSIFESPWTHVRDHVPVLLPSGRNVGDIQRPVPDLPELDALYDAYEKSFDKPGTDADADADNEAEAEAAL